MNILITGASGFTGTALVKYLADKHTVICLSRQAPEGSFVYVQGSFDSVEDLGGLDSPEREKIRVVNKSCDNGEYRCFLSNSESFNICKIGFEHLTIE